MHSGGAPPGEPVCLTGSVAAPKPLRGLGGGWAAYTFGGVQTSIRAELVAIREAVRLCPGGGELVVFTDCLSAMNLLGRWWRAPNSMLLHHERPLVEGIASCILAREGPVRLAKVRSHVGIPGNEAADAIAGLASTGAGAQHLQDAPSCYPRGIGLATTWANVGRERRRPSTDTAVAPPTTLPGGQPAPEDKYCMYNAPVALRRVAARVVTSRAATRSIGYAQAMGDDPLAAGPFSLLPRESNALWNRLPDSSLRTCVRVRSNQFFAGPQACGAGLVPHPYCTICPDRVEHDGWRHSLTRCEHPVVHGLRCLRHNEVAGILVAAVTHGKRGNVTVMADLKKEPEGGATLGEGPAGSGREEDPQAPPPGAPPHVLHGWDPPGGEVLPPDSDAPYDESLEALPGGTGGDADDAVRTASAAGGPVLVGTELWDRLPAVPFVPGLDGDTFAFTGTQSRTIPAWALRTSLTPDVVLIEGLKGDTPPSAGDPGVVFTQNGRAHLRTPVTVLDNVCRLRK